MIRLSVVTETYIPDVNGVANSLRELLAALAPEHYELQIIRTVPRASCEPQWQEVWSPGISLPMYPDMQIGLPAKGRVRRAWDEFHPDLVFIVTEGPLGLSALREAKRRNLPVLSAFHTNFHQYGQYYRLGWLTSLLERWLRHIHNRSDATLVPSEDIANDLNKKGFERVHVIAHGVDCRLFTPEKYSVDIRARWRVTRANKVLLFVGRIAAEKNISLLVKTYRTLQQQDASLRLVMIGDGPLRESMQATHPDILFAGVLKGQTLAEHIASADAFLFPSLTDTFGLVTLEAMACGLPVVAYDLACAHDVITCGVNGELAYEKTDEAFIAATRTLLMHDLARLGANARETAINHSWQRSGRKLDDLIRALIELHHQKVTVTKRLGRTRLRRL